MNKGQLIEKLAEDAEISKVQAGKVLESFIAAVTTSLKKKTPLALVGFGTFDVLKRKARTGRNPATGEPIKIKAQNSVKFRAGKTLKLAVNGGKK